MQCSEPRQQGEILFVREPPDAAGHESLFRNTQLAARRAFLFFRARMKDLARPRHSAQVRSNQPGTASQRVRKSRTPFETAMISRREQMRGGIRQEANPHRETSDPRWCGRVRSGPSVQPERQAAWQSSSLLAR